MHFNDNNPGATEESRPRRQISAAITGANGFLGRHLVERLRGEGEEPHALVGDTRDISTFSPEFDVLFHLAAALPDRFASDPDSGFRANVAGVINALEACRRNAARMVFLSTSGVYASSPRPVRETDPIDLINAYTQSKFAGEALCRTYGEIYGVPVVILRVFNVYGPGQTAGVVPYVLNCLAEASEAVITSPGSARDFIHVDDVVATVIAAAETETPFGVFNVGSGVATTIADFIKVAETASGASLVRRIDDGFSDPHKDSIADISLIGEHFNWTPKITLQAGLGAMMGDRQKANP